MKVQDITQEITGKRVCVGNEQGTIDRVIGNSYTQQINGKPSKAEVVGVAVQMDNGKIYMFFGLRLGEVGVGAVSADWKDTLDKVDFLPDC